MVFGKRSRDLPLAGHVYANDGSMRLRGCVPIPSGKQQLISCSQSACTASSFEKSLSDSFTQKRTGFWDAVAVFVGVDRSVIEQWRVGASELSKDLDPPGEVFERPVAEGDLIAFPVVGGGFGIGLAARASSRRGVQSLEWLSLDRWYPNRPLCEDLSDIDQSNSLRFFRINSWECRYGRWAPVGAMQNYNRDRWILPPQLVDTGIEMPSGDPWMPNRLGRVCRAETENHEHAINAYPGPYDPVLINECERWNTFSTDSRVEYEHGLWRHKPQRSVDIESHAYSELLSPEVRELWRRLVEL